MAIVEGVIICRSRKQIVYDIEINDKTYNRDRIFKDVVDNTVFEKLTKVVEELKQEFGIDFQLWL